jgi:hypothetical protein
MVKTELPAVTIALTMPSRQQWLRLMIVTLNLSILSIYLPTPWLASIYWLMNENEMVKTELPAVTIPLTTPSRRWK